MMALHNSGVHLESFGWVDGQNLGVGPAAGDADRVQLIPRHLDVVRVDRVARHLSRHAITSHDWALSHVQPAIVVSTHVRCQDAKTKSAWKTLAKEFGKCSGLAATMFSYLQSNISGVL